MTKRKTLPKRVKKAEEQSARFFIVNPAGAIHEVTKEHAQERLRQVGYRQATTEEVHTLMEQGGNQRFNEPICKPWSPEPEPIAGIEELDLEGLQRALDGDESSESAV